MDVTIEGCDFDRSTIEGAAVSDGAVSAQGRVAITDSTFTQNEAKLGEGAQAETGGGVSNSGELIVSGEMISGNSPDQFSSPGTVK